MTMVDSYHPARRALWFAVPAACLVLAGQAWAQDAKGGDKAPAPARTIIAFEHASCETFLHSKKDAALLAALKLVPVRITEIMDTPGLGPDKDEVPEGIVDLVTRALTGPMRMAVTQQPSPDGGPMPKLGMVLSYPAKDQDDAKLMMNRVENIRNMAEQHGGGVHVQKSQRFPEMNAIVLPPGTLLYGPRQGKDGWKFEVIFGNVADPDGAMWDSLPKAAGGQTVAARGVLDFSAATPIAEMLGGMASMWMPNSTEFMQGLREAGFVGDQAMSVEMVCGHDSAGCGNTITVHRAGAHAEALGLVKSKVTDADLAIVPGDSVFAHVAKIEPQASWARVNKQFGAMPQFAEVLGHVNGVLGIDVEKDLVSTLGGTSACCMSDTTGGNTLFSAVGFFEIKDPARLAATMDKLSAKANEFLSHQMAEGGPKPGTIAMTSWVEPSGAAQGVKFTALRFPGLPVPLEPTLAMADRWLVVGFNPQSCTAAAGHAMSVKASGGKGGLGANAAFASATGDRIKDATSVTFIDSASTIRDGYPVLQMLGSALTNFARSPSSSSARQVAQVVPTLAELRAGVKPIVWTTTWSGDDLVMSSRGDDSILVNAAAVLGTGDVGEMIFGGILGAGIAADAAKKHEMHRGHADHHEGADADEGADEPEMDADDAPEAPEAPEAPKAPENQKRQRHKAPM